MIRKRSSTSPILLTEFVQIENMYRITDESGQRVQYLFDMLTQASNEMSPAFRRDYYKHLGDLTLFNLGLFPESLTYGHRTVSPDYYAETGRRSYTIVADMDRVVAAPVFTGSFPNNSSNAWSA